MAITVVDFQSQEWDSETGREDCGGLGGFSAQNVLFLVNQGGAAITQTLQGQRRLAFRRKCPFNDVDQEPDPNAILVIRFDTAHPLVEFELEFSVLPSQLAPVVVSFYGAPFQSNLIITESSSVSPMQVSYHRPCLSVREIVVFSPRDENFLDNLEFGAVPPPHPWLHVLRVNRVACLIERIGVRVVRAFQPEPLTLNWPQEDDPPEKTPE